MKLSVEKETFAVAEKFRWLPLGAIAGPIVFTLAWLTLGFFSTGYTIFDMRVESYSIVAQPISGLGMGNTAPFMNAAFILSGLLLLAGIIGIFQAIKDRNRPKASLLNLLLFILSPIGLVICGIYNLEAMMPHLLGFLLSTGTCIVSFLTAGLFLRGNPRWRRFGNWLLAGSPLTLAFVIFFFLTFDPLAAGEGEGIAGIASRLLAVEVLAWFMALGWMSYHQTKKRRSA